jgi:uncharacterized protein
VDILYSRFEIKTGTADDGTFSGYGSVFGNVDSYGDTVAPGAFRRTILDAKSGNAPWPVLLSQHDSHTPIGIWLDMAEDDHGLKLQGKLAINTKRGRDAYHLLKMTPRPALDGLSIGYRAKDYELHKHSTGPNGAKRTLKAVDLIEVSLVTFPADRFARVASVKFEREPVVDEAQLRREWAKADFEMLCRASQGKPRYG